MAAIFYHDGKWYEQPPAIFGPQVHALWAGSGVFDGARSFDGLAPDLDRHCARLVRSATILGMNVPVTGEEVAELCRQAIRKLPKEAVTYVRPMMFPTAGGFVPDPDSTAFCITVFEMPFPPKGGFSACRSSFRRPARDMAPTDAKAACLYPNGARAMREAGGRGFQNAVVLDPNGNVAEFANSNLWLVKDGLVKTPAANGTFLNGLTRQRVMALLAGAGYEISETTVTFEDVHDADELFNSGNQGKVQACIRIEDRELQPGPVFQAAKKLYFEFAQASSVF